MADTRTRADKRLIVPSLEVLGGIVAGALLALLPMNQPFYFGLSLIVLIIVAHMSWRIAGLSGVAGWKGRSGVACAVTIILGVVLFWGWAARFPTTTPAGPSPAAAATANAAPPPPIPPAPLVAQPTLQQSTKAVSAKVTPATPLSAQLSTTQPQKPDCARQQNVFTNMSIEEPKGPPLVLNGSDCNSFRDLNITGAKSGVVLNNSNNNTFDRYHYSSEHEPPPAWVSAPNSEAITQAGIVVGQAFGARRSPTDATRFEIVEITHAQSLNWEEPIEYQGITLQIEHYDESTGMDSSRPQDGRLFKGITARVIK